MQLNELATISRSTIGIGKTSLQSKVQSCRFIDVSYIWCISRALYGGMEITTIDVELKPEAKLHDLKTLLKPKFNQTNDK